MNEGFFNTEEVAIVRGDEQHKKKSPSQKIANCSTCGLHEKSINPKLGFSGEGKLKILIVGDYSGKDDDKNGSHFLGESGELLEEIIGNLGYDLNEHFWMTNALQCYCNNAKGPSAVQIEACRKRLHETIDELNPNVIVALGKVAMDGLVGDKVNSRIKKLKESDWVGFSIPDQELQKWIVSTWSLDMILRWNVEPAMYDQLQDSFKEAIRLKDSKVYTLDYEDVVNILTDEDEVIDLLQSIIKKGGLYSYDYETTGKKPYMEGHGIVTISLSNGKETWAFPNFNTPLFKKFWKKFLVTVEIKKVAHNIKFEALWSKHIFNHFGCGNLWDTMLGSKVIKNKGRSGLKFLIYVYFGVIGYDDEVSDFLEAPKNLIEIHGSNAFNKIKSVDINKLLKYNGLDSYFTILLYKKQKKQLEEPQRNAVKFLTNSVLSFAMAEYKGIRIDRSVAQEVEKKISNKMKRFEKVVLLEPALKKWNKKTPFRLSAPEDLSHLLFNIMDHKPLYYTKTNKAKMDKETLEEYDIPIVKNVLKWRKYKKARDTYLKNFMREAVNDYINPFFNLDTVDTFRSSSDSPNFQNIPTRDKVIKQLLRSILKPHKGHKLIEYDYKGIEVAISACYHKDPNMINYITDTTTDMHRDMAMEIYLRSQDEVSKVERSVAKNAFVFPEFYGSYFAQVAPDLWNKAPNETIQHLQSNGIHDLIVFTEHIKRIEDAFWNERFAVYSEWKEELLDFYENNGYVEFLTGFKCYGPMRRNQIINYPIQGTAFHCLLWTFNALMKEMIKRSMNSLIIGQIHDAIIISVDPDEEQEVDQMVYEIGTKKIKEHWDWIIVPLEIEKEASVINGNWAEMEDCGIIKF